MNPGETRDYRWIKHPTGWVLCYLSGGLITLALLMEPQETGQGPMHFVEQAWSHDTEALQT